MAPNGSKRVQINPNVSKSKKNCQEILSLSHFGLVFCMNATIRSCQGFQCFNYASFFDPSTHFVSCLVPTELAVNIVNNVITPKKVNNWIQSILSKGSILSLLNILSILLIGHTVDTMISLNTLPKLFSLTRPSMTCHSISRNVSPFACCCMLSPPHAIFIRPLISPQYTWSVSRPPISNLPPSLFYFFPNIFKHAHILTQAVYTPNQSAVNVSELFSGKSHLATLFLGYKGKTQIL